MDHETLERLNESKGNEARRLGVRAAASPEVATTYRKSRAELERHDRLWIRDCARFREAHFSGETGTALRLLLEEMYAIGQHATGEIAALRAIWAAEDAARDAEALAGQVPHPKPKAIIAEDGSSRLETHDEAARRVVRETLEQSERAQAALVARQQELADLRAAHGGNGCDDVECEFCYRGEGTGPLMAVHGMRAPRVPWAEVERADELAREAEARGVAIAAESATREATKKRKA
jgi:hypothetical protein